MAVRTGNSQIRQLYVGTGTETSVADGDAIITGNVGIGSTTAPGEKLTVTGKALLNNGSSLYIDSSATQTVFANIVDIPIRFQTNSANRLTIGGAGAIQFNDYGAGTLVTDASGNITAATSGPGTGTVTGSGAGLRVAYWLGTNQLTSNAGFTFQGNDLKIPRYLMHDGETNTYFGFATTAAPVIYAGGWKLFGNNNLKFAALYGDNGIKLSTTLTGISVTGEGIFTGNVGIGTTSPGTFLQLGTYAVPGKYIDQATYPDIPSEHMMHITAPSTSAYYGGGISFGETAFTAANIVVRDAGGSGALDLCFGTGTFSGITEKMRITNGGSVGIGTDDPLDKLDVSNGDIRISQTGNVAAQLTLNSYQLAVGPTNYAWFVRNTTSATAYSFQIGNRTTPYLHIKSLAYGATAGNVGIGSTSPTEKLEVAGNVILNASSARLKLKGGVTGTNSGIDWTFSSTTAQYARIDLDYDTRASTGLLIDSLYPITLDFGNWQGHFAIQNNGSEKMRVSANGNVGIGNTSPDFKLHTNLDLIGTPLAYLNSTSALFNATANIGVTHNSTAVGTNTSAGVYLANNANNNGAPSPLIAFSALSEAGTRNHTYAAIYGIKTATGIGTSWNKGDLIFATGDGAGPITRMRIFANGVVGIGVTNPGTSMLQVAGALSGPIVKFDNTSTTGSGLEVNGGTANSFALKVGSRTGSELMRVQGDGNVGIGTTGPNTQLEISNINDNPATLRLSSDLTDADLVGAIISFSNDAGSGGVQGRIENVSTDDDSTVFKFYTDNTSSPSMTLFDSGNMTIAGTLTQNSDVRLKENIKPIKSALDKVKQMQGVEFNKINSSTKEIGVVAQEIEKIIPELVLEDKEGIKSVAYGNITAVLIEAIKEQQKQIEELKQQLNK